MGRFHQLKQELKQSLSTPDWLAFLQEHKSSPELLGPLLGFLPQGGELGWRAVRGLGILTATLAETGQASQVSNYDSLSHHEHSNLHTAINYNAQHELARQIMRRFMWHMNEESGNLGWGIPESMGEAAALSPALAKEFGHILFSYLHESDGEGNYIDYPPLLARCFWGAGRLALARPELAEPYWPDFMAGLRHNEAQVRGQAALALLKLLRGLKEKNAAPKNVTQNKIQTLEAILQVEPAQIEALRASLQKLLPDRSEHEDFDGEQICYQSLGTTSAKTLELLDRLWVEKIRLMFFPAEIALNAKKP